MCLFSLDAFLLFFVCTVCVFCFLFVCLSVCVCVAVCVARMCPQPLPQLQEAKQLERERHRQHSPVTQHTEPDSPQLQSHTHPPGKGSSQEANGPVTPPTPSINIPSTPSTPSTPAPEGSSRSVSGEQEEQGPVYESPDPENGSDFCVAENEQTEADQATAAAQSKTLIWSYFTLLFVNDNGFISLAEMLSIIELNMCPCWLHSRYFYFQFIQGPHTLIKSQTCLRWFIQSIAYLCRVYFSIETSGVIVISLNMHIKSFTLPFCSFHSEKISLPEPAFTIMNDFIAHSSQQRLIHCENWCRIRTNHSVTM